MLIIALIVLLTVVLSTGVVTTGWVAIEWKREETYQKRLSNEANRDQLKMLTEGKDRDV